jgi:hypothetical protein
MAGFILLAFTIGLVIITLFLWRSVERKQDPAKFSNYKGPGFMHKDGSVTLRDGTLIPPDEVKKQSNVTYAPPPDRYSAPPARDDFSSQVPYNPKLLKQPDYEDFFSDKKKPVNMDRVMPDKPDAVSDISLMPAAPIPEQPGKWANNTQVTEYNYFDELLAPPSDDDISNSLKKAEPETMGMEPIEEITVPESESSYQYEDPISDMNLEEYLSTDYLSSDKKD